MNPEHFAKLNEGVEVWNEWRREHPDTRPDLSGVDLAGHSLAGFNLRDAALDHAFLREIRFDDADLTGATLVHSVVTFSSLRRAKLVGAYLGSVNLSESDLTDADLTDAIMDWATLVNTCVENATFTRCVIYGISAWSLRGEPRDQSELIIATDPRVTVDDLEIAQFVYLLTNSDKLRKLITNLGSKGVLILGRFTSERLEILHAIRDEVRKREDLLPIMFEFKPQASKTTMETLMTLAHMSRFVVADLTEAKAVVQELTKITDSLRSLPVKLIIHESGKMPSMSDSFLVQDSVLKPVYRYSSREQLLEDLDSEVIGPANEWADEFEKHLTAIRREYVPWQNEN